VGRGARMSGGPLAEADLARIVHDLRSPLMPLQTAAWLLRQEAGESARVRDLAELIERQSARRARMLDELGDWERGIAGELAHERQPVEARLVVDLAIGGMCEARIEPSYAGDAASAPLSADLHRLQQMLQALIEHALWRGDGQPPDIGVAAEDGMLRIRIRDHGAPLDADAREALLSHPQARPCDQGLGLRLLLARRIVEAHGGHLVVVDDPSAGLALCCSLPIAS